MIESKVAVQAASAQHQLADEIQAMLPQLQCGKCGYPGCRPYAEALAAQSTTTDLCLPGGDKTARAIAAKLNIDIDKLRHIPADTDRQVAHIDENRCVGCYKCIEACPVDTIIGAHGLMHTVLTTNCTGCGLCVEPCPVDCIDLVATPETTGDGQIVYGGVIDRPAAVAAARNLRLRHERKLARPPLRGSVAIEPLAPQELARRAMDRVRRKVNPNSKS